MKKILVIDDDDLSRSLYRTVLEKKKYAVLESDNGADGIALYKSETPDLVITDIFMEDKDGLEVIEELLAYQQDARIIAITGASGGKPGTPDYLGMATQLGAVAVYAKPIDWKAMVRDIASLLENGAPSAA